MKRIIKDNYTQSTTAYLNYTDTLNLLHLGFVHDHISAIYWNEGDHCLHWVNNELENSPEEFVIDYKENIFKNGTNIGHIIPAITLEDAVNFFRTEYNIYLTACPTVEIKKNEDDIIDGYYATGSFIWKFNRFDDDNRIVVMRQSNNKESGKSGNNTYTSYQAALEAGIQELINEINIETEPLLPFDEPDDSDVLPF